MPLKALRLKPGVNRENTRYTTEGGWYECDKIRFRQGFPEAINGWQRLSANTFRGVCRSLWNWATLGGSNLVGVGTNLKFYIENGGLYNDITPIRETQALTNPFDTTISSTTVTVNDTGHGAVDGDFVTFSGAAAVGGITIDGEYQITYVDVDTYTIEHSSAATSSVTGGGGASVSAAYQLNVGAATAVPSSGYGAGGYGMGLYGTGTSTTSPIRLWSQNNFGEDLIFAPRGGKLCHWDATTGASTRATLVENASGALEVPDTVNITLVSDISRFVFAFGCPPEGSTTLDPMLIRWSDQEDYTDWKASATNQAGSIRVSHGTEIVSVAQARQEVLVWTNEALYSLQYLGAPDGWGAQLLGDNTSIASQNASVYVNNTAMWMGTDQFFIYDGTVRVLPCDLRKYVFGNQNSVQKDQTFAGVNEAYSEVWWFYCSSGSTTVDRYVVYNYRLNIWYYGTMARTAWLDAKLRAKPLAATYSYNLVQHELGTDDNETGTPAALNPYIVSSHFDIDDGDRFSFIRRVLPDITFDGSTVSTPSVTMTLYPLNSSGSDYNNPRSIGGTNSLTVTQGTTVDIEPFTEQAFVRLRGRQIALRVESNTLGVTWQLGTPRIDIRPDGRR